MEHIFDKGVTVKNFVKFVWPSVLMMVVIALYYGFDSVFVANLVGETREFDTLEAEKQL